MNGMMATDAVPGSNASGVGNSISIILLSICLAWPVVNRMLTSDLDNKSQYLPHFYVCTRRADSYGSGSVRRIRQQPTLQSHEDAV